MFTQKSLEQGRDDHTIDEFADGRMHRRRSLHERVTFCPTAAR
jgi:hypothetical protein